MALDTKVSPISAWRCPLLVVVPVVSVLPVVLGANCQVVASIAGQETLLAELQAAMKAAQEKLAMLVQLSLYRHWFSFIFILLANCARPQYPTQPYTPPFRIPSPDLGHAGHVKTTNCSCESYTRHIDRLRCGACRHSRPALPVSYRAV